MLNNNIKIIGEFNLNVFRVVNNKKIFIKNINENNLVVTLGKKALRNLITNTGSGNYISYIGFGTSSNTPNISDSLLVDQYIKSLDGHTDDTDTSTIFSFNLDTTEYNGYTIKEYGLFTNNSELFARKIIVGGIEKDSDVVLDGTWRIVFI